MSRVMYSPLYLDTARIGLMTPQARQSCDDAMALAMHDPAHVFLQFQMDGSSDAIRHWSGIGQLRKDVLEQIAIPTHNQLLMASNSASLLALAARCLFSLAPNVLVTDLIWPNHFNGLNIERMLSSSEIFAVEVREQIIEGEPVDSIVSKIVTAYEQNNCRALFLTAISSDGIRLPVEEIIDAVTEIKSPRMVVVDGAQEFAQLRNVSANEKVDLYLFGSHKWLGAYHPLSLATFGCPGSAMVINQILSRMISAGDVNDPTLKSSINDRFEYNETLNLLPFFSLAGAIETHKQNKDMKGGLVESRIDNLHQFSQVTSEAGWKERFIDVQDDFKSAISIIEQPNRAFRSNEIEKRLRTSGISATFLPDGGIRASMPSRPFAREDYVYLSSVLSCL